MGKIKVYNSENAGLKENFNEILKEISEIKPQTTFTKEQEEEFLKDAIVIFEYLKSGIDIKSSEILINNGELPFSCIEKILINFSENQKKDESKARAYHVYQSKEGKPVKIYELQKNDKKDKTSNSDRFLDKHTISWKRKILLVKPNSSTERDSITKPQLKKIIDYALENDVILLFDATSNKENNGIENVKSIYEIENAKKIAIEFKRLPSIDNDNFTCGYLVIPESLRFQCKDNKEYKFCNIKDILQKEMQKGIVSRKSLKKSFLNYACL